jgi:hypothetical protein
MHTANFNKVRMELGAKGNNVFVKRNLLKLVCHSALHSVVSQTKVNIFLLIQINIILKENACVPTIYGIMYLGIHCKKPEYSDSKHE